MPVRAPVVIYYLVLVAFAFSVGYFFVSLGNGLTKQYKATEIAIQQEREVGRHNKMVK